MPGTYANSHSENEDKQNKKYKTMLDLQKKTMDSDGGDVKDIAHKMPGSSGTYSGPMESPLMNFTQILETLEAVGASIEQHNADPMNASVSETSNEWSGGSTEETENELLDQLNQIFTPILVMQGFENDVSDQIKEAFSEASVLTEKNIIKFDDATRMAQLISVCALLIERKRNTQEYQTYEQAAKVRNQMKVAIEKKNYEEAKALAQKYLVKVSTTNNSSVARDAANDLMPETQH